MQFEEIKEIIKKASDDNGIKEYEIFFNKR